VETTLFSLENPFKDSAISDEDFFCGQCVLLEGVLAKFPNKLTELNVERIAFPRPRVKVVEKVGVENQSLPTLILGEGVLVGQETGRFGETRYIKGKDEILNALTEIYKIPRIHP
jgi:hypothetical protein